MATVYFKDLLEKMQQGYAVRYTSKTGNRLVQAYKSKDKADQRAGELRKDGAKDISITTHNLNFKEESDHEVSMARGELEAIADKATQLSAALQGKSDEGNPLEAWVQSKITKAKDYINSVSDYLMYNPEQSNEEKECPPGMYYCKMSKTCKPLSMKNEELEEQATEKEVDKFHTDLDKLVHKSFGPSSDEKKEKMDEKVADSIIKTLQKAYAPLKGKKISPEMANKMSKHLDQPSYDVDTLRQLVKANIPFISTLAKNKIYKKTGKFEEVVVEEKTDQEKISDLRTARSNVQNKINDMDRSDPKSKTPLTIAQNDLENINLKINQLSKKMQGESFSNTLIQKASNRLTEKAYGWTLVSKAKDLAKKFANNMTKAVQEIEKLEKGLSDNPEVYKAIRQYNEEIHPHAKEMAKDGVSDEKIKKMHPEITADELKKLKESDAYDNQRYMMKKYMGQILAKPDNANTKDGKDHVYAPNAKIAKQLYSKGKKVYKEDSKELQKDKTDNYKEKNKEKIEEQIEGIKNKSEKSGVPYGILKQVYDRGMAAWKGGHRPGASQQQWAYARINSFLTKGKTYYTADADLAKKARKSKKKD